MWVVCVSGTLVCSQLLENGRQAAPSGTFPSLLRAASWSGSQPKHSRPNLDARLPRLGWIFNFDSHLLNGCPTRDGQSGGLRSIACFSRPRPPPLHQPAATQDGSCPSSPAPTRRRGQQQHTRTPPGTPEHSHAHVQARHRRSPAVKTAPRPTSNAA